MNTSSSGNSPLRGVATLRNGFTRRVSTWDQSGGNNDAWKVLPHETCDMANIDGPGTITHLWMTLKSPDKYYLRKVVLEAFWDDESQPSIQCPLGDFFCLGFGKVRRFASLPFAVLCADDYRVNSIVRRAGFNCYLPMPFAKRAHLRLRNETDETLKFFFHVDYELEPAAAEGKGRLHAQWRREKATTPVPPPTEERFSGKNLTGEENYLLLEAEGHGHYIGCNLSVDREEGKQATHEGDDMFFIDSDTWPPSLHGTGTEDYFGSAWSYPCKEFAGPYQGVTVYGENEFESSVGQLTSYRFHIEDPVIFHERLRVSIEHGNANECAADYSSVAYWYQAEPHKPFPELPAVEERLPFR